MRPLIILTVFASGAVWAFDKYEYDGRNVVAAWTQAQAQGKNFRSGVQGMINNAMSGR
jgi:hypothetical protein